VKRAISRDDSDGLAYAMRGTSAATAKLHPDALTVRFAQTRPARGNKGIG
jgi:hypothetical protein